MSIILIEVLSSNDKKIFHQLPRNLHKHDSRFVSYLDADIESVFDPYRNCYFEHGDACRWLCVDGDVSLGRITAFYNHDRNFSGIGFFESVNDQDVAHLLFKKAESWLKERGFDKAEAPVNFGERNKYWGLLLESERPASFQENFHPPYYSALFRQNGYKERFKQITAEIELSSFDTARLESVLSRMDKRFTVEHFRKKNATEYLRDISMVYNQAFKELSHFEVLGYERVEALFREMKPMLREDQIWFTYFEDRPVGILVCIPELNSIFKRFNGSFGLIEKFKYYMLNMTGSIKKVRAVLFGVIPQFQNRAVFAAMILEFCAALRKDPTVDFIELSWIGDFNPKMQALLKHFGAKTTKIHGTFEKAF